MALEELQLHVAGGGDGLGLLFPPVHFAADGIVQEEVELDGKVGLHGIGAVVGAKEGRLVAAGLLPQVAPHTVANLAVVDVRNKEIDMPVVYASGNVLDAQPLASALKQNLNDVPMENVIHPANVRFSMQRYK